MSKVGYKDMRDRFIWPTSVLCEKHQTPANIDSITRLMICYNTTAFPIKLEGKDAELECVKCKEEEENKNASQ